MTDANAYDPSTWGDPVNDGHQQGTMAEAPWEPGQGPDDTPPAHDRAALEAELADLTELIRSTTAQRDKAQAVVDDADTALGRLNFRIEAVERELEQSHTDENEG